MERAHITVNARAHPNQLFYAEGTYTVSYGGLGGSFEVKEPKPSFWDKIPGFPYESIILGLMIGTFVLWLLSRRKMNLI